MDIISFTMNFQRERLDIRYADNTEKCIRYRDIYPGLKKPVKATDKQIDAHIKMVVSQIEASGFDDKQKKAEINRAQATSERAKAKVFVENDLSAVAADVAAKKTIADITKKMRAAIEGL